MNQPNKSTKKYKLLKNDEVIVTTGRSKGAIGTVEKIDRKNDRVYISGVNLYKKHKKATNDKEKSAIIDVPMPLHISNVALIDPKTKKATRVGYKIENDVKVRFAKSSGQTLVANR
jgi:large subunit ribosomal protein L24